MNWYFKVLKKYAVFSGRARRKEFWYFFLFYFITNVVLMVIDKMTSTFSTEVGMGPLSGLYTLVLLIPSIAVTVRRLHDTDRSGWWFLIWLIPLIGSLVLLVFTVQDGTPILNRYGANPKDAPPNLSRVGT